MFSNCCSWCALLSQLFLWFTKVNHSVQKSITLTYRQMEMSVLQWVVLLAAHRHWETNWRHRGSQSLQYWGRQTEIRTRQNGATGWTEEDRSQKDHRHAAHTVQETTGKEQRTSCPSQTGQKGESFQTVLHTFQLVFVSIETHTQSQSGFQMWIYDHFARFRSFSRSLRLTRQSRESWTNKHRTK